MLGDAAKRIARKRRAQRAELWEFTRQVLAELVEQLTPSERRKFSRIFDSDDPQQIDSRELNSAIELCERTIERHRRRILDVIAEATDE